jgi:hypothetical protein
MMRYCECDPSVHEFAMQRLPRRFRRTSIGIALSLALSSCSGIERLLAPASAPPPTGASKTVHGPAYAPDAATRGAADPSGDWGAYNRTLGGDRYSPTAAAC